MACLAKLRSRTQSYSQDFERELLHSSLVEALHDCGGFEDQYSLGDPCPIHTNAVLYQPRRERIWELIKTKYVKLRERMSQK